MLDRDFTDIPETLAGELGKRTPRPVRSVYAPTLLEHFFVSAVVAVLLIRAWLEITGYPQIGGDGLHIAHMLFGGFMMMSAIVIMLTYLGRRARLIAAILGGAGFGTFIDELGKFITSDNDYFFQPTIALIYIIFVLLFLLGERLVRLVQATPTERLAQALDATTDAVIEQFPASERELALHLLAESDPKSPLTGSTQRALRKIAAQPDPPPNLAERATKPRWTGLRLANVPTLVPQVRAGGLRGRHLFQPCGPGCVSCRSILANRKSSSPRVSSLARCCSPTRLLAPCCSSACWRSVAQCSQPWSGFGARPWSLSSWFSQYRFMTSN